MPLIRKPPESVAAPAKAAAEPFDTLKSGTSEERWSAARSLTEPEDIHLLGSALETEDQPRVREAILTSLMKIGGPQAATVIAAQIASDDAAVRTAALDTLRAMPGEAATVLPSLLADPDADIRILACDLVRGAPSPDTLVQLCALLDEETETNVAAAVIEVLAEVGGPSALPALARAAARFDAEPFVAFSAKVAAERISIQPGDAGE